VAKAKKNKSVKSKVVSKAKAQKKVKAKAKPVVKAKAKVKVKKVTAKKTKAVAKKSKSVTVKKTNKKTAVKQKQNVKNKIQPKLKPIQNNVDYTKAITPLGDRLVVRQIQAERMTAGGLILPDSVNSEAGYLKGLVLAAGQGEFSKKGHLKILDVKVGQKILFSEYASTKVTFQNEELHIVHEKDVLGIVE